MENFVKEFNQYFENFSYKEREKKIKEIDKKVYDLLIIGGGITGAGIAREAALRGYSFCLIDKEDFAFGTSSKSSKLAHGGFRYLSQGEIKLVRESTTERNWLAQALPNLVEPLGFIVNTYEGGKDSLLKIKVAVFLYDLISNFLSKYKNPKKHKFLSREKIIEMEPAVKRQGLLGGAIYYDTNVDDSRLTIETIKEAIAISKNKKIDSYAFSYCRFLGFEQEDGGTKYDNEKADLGYRIAYVQDMVEGLTYAVKAKLVVNASGIWIDEVLEKCGVDKKFIRPTKGVHLVVKRERLGNNNAFGLRSIDDGRFFFVIRRGDYSYIGTTDTDYNENLDAPFCEKKDCDYLLNTINVVFPNANITYKDIISTYAGVRPLIKEEGKSESAISRKHLIFDHGKRFITIGGGKLTIFRKMAQDLILFAQKKGYLGKDKEKGKVNISKKNYLIAIKDKNLYNKNLEKFGITKQYFDYCIRQYGKGAFIIFDYIIKNPEYGKRFIDDYLLTKAEVIYHFNYEMALKVSDILERRTETNCLLHYSRQRELATKVADFIHKFYGFDKTELDKQVNEYLEKIEKATSFLKD